MLVVFLGDSLLLLFADIGVPSWHTLNTWERDEEGLSYDLRFAGFLF